MKAHNTFESKIRSKSYIWQSFILSLFLIVGIQALRYLVPDFVFGNSRTYFQQVADHFFNSTANLYGQGIAYCTFDILLWIVNFFGTWIFCRYLFNYLTYKKWFFRYIGECTKVINSCDVSTLKDRVAIVIPICNDISENTIKQTTSQTYKCDVWLLDDSSKQEATTRINNYAKQHGYNVIHRPDDHKKAHPSKVGNIYYFLGLHGDEYDYIFETDSSTITTNTFVENALRFFHSPLIDTNKLSAMVCNGSFYPTNNLFSWINAKQSQWTEAHMLNSAMRMGGSHVSYQGWGTIIKTSILKQIPLEEVECSICDMARGFYISRHGLNCYMDPFDFSGKIAQQNMYRWKNQKMKWAGGDAFIFKHLVAGKKFDDPQKTFFIHCWSLACSIFIPLTTILQLVTIILACTSNFVSSMSFSVILIIACYGIIIFVPIIITMIIWRTNIKLLICTLLSLMFEFGILFRRVYQLLIYGLILGKWSSAKVTIKSKETLTFGQWLRTTLFDWCWIVGTLAICAPLTYCTNINIAIIWGNLFTFLSIPSILYVVCSLFSFIKLKKGWQNDTVWYDIAANDFRFKYIKESIIWKQQHSSCKQK